MFLLLFSLPFRTKWKRQTSVGLELFVEAGNYAAYQRACASRFAQFDPLSYSTNPLMLSAAHGLMPAMPPSDLHYQRSLSGGLSSVSPYGFYSGVPSAMPPPMSLDLLQRNGAFPPVGSFYPGSQSQTAFDAHRPMAAVNLEKRSSPSPKSEKSCLSAHESDRDEDDEHIEV